MAALPKFRVYKAQTGLLTAPFELFDNDENYILNGIAEHYKEDQGDKVVQFTGFTDHAGTEIYDKAIVQFTHPNPAKNNKRPQINMVVGWNKKHGAWHLYWRQYDGEIAHQTLGKTLDDNHTVIGHAYEQPELAQ